MKTIISILISFFTCYQLLAQSSSGADSLKTVLKGLPEFGYSYSTDTLRLALENTVIRQSIFSINSDSALFRAEQNLEMVQKLGYKRGEGDALITLMFVYSSRNETLNTIETLYRALHIFEKLKDKKQIAYISRSLGDNYHLANDEEKAIAFIKRAMDIYKSLGDHYEYAITLNNLGLLFQDHNKYQESIDYFNQAIQYVHERKVNVELLGYIYPNLARSYQEIKDFDKAIEFYEKTLEFSHGFEVRRYLSLLAQIHLTKIYYLKNDKVKAIEHFLNAEDVFSTEAVGMDDLKRDFYEIGWEIYRDKGDFEKALTYFEKFSELNRRISLQSNERKISSLQLEYDNQAQEIRILNLRRVVFLIGLSVTFLLVLGYFLIKNISRLKERNNTIIEQKTEISIVNSKLAQVNSNLEAKVEERTLELLELNRELKSKNAAILNALVEGKKIERKRVSAELHDNLGSTLSAIRFRLQAIDPSSLSEEEKEVYDSSLEMLSSAYSDLRNISHHLLSENFEKEGLKNSLDKYIGVINMVGKIRFTFDYDLHHSFDNPHVELEIYGICMELINNVLKHSDGDLAEVKVWSSDQYVHLSLSDNGSPILVVNEGFGLKNIRHRLSYMNGSMTVLSEKSFEVFLSIPIS